MSQLGQLSIAHEYDAKGECIHCHMYKNVVETLSHECSVKRELEVDPRDPLPQVAAAVTMAGDRKKQKPGDSVINPTVPAEQVPADQALDEQTLAIRGNPTPDPPVVEQPVKKWGWK